MLFLQQTDTNLERVDAIFKKTGRCAVVFMKEELHITRGAFALPKSSRNAFLINQGYQTTFI